MWTEKALKRLEEINKTARERDGLKNMLLDVRKAAGELSPVPTAQQIKKLLESIKGLSR